MVARNNSLRYIIVLLIAGSLQAAAQDNVIDLGTDTIGFDPTFEYVAAFEMERYMESYVFYRSAMEAYQRDDLVSAKAAVNKAIKLNDRELKFKLLKAWVLSKERSYKKAIKYSGRILETYPESQEALYCKALNQYLLNDHYGANRTYTELLELNELDARAFFGRAETKMKLEDFQGAIDDYTRALYVRPTLVLAYEGRGMAHFRLFNFRSAVVDFNQFIVARPDSGKAYHYRGLAHLRLSEFSQACKSFEEAVRLRYKDSSEYFAKYCKY